MFSTVHKPRYVKPNDRAARAAPAPMPAPYRRPRLTQEDAALLQSAAQQMIRYSEVVFREVEAHFDNPPKSAQELEARQERLYQASAKVWAGRHKVEEKLPLVRFYAGAETVLPHVETALADAQDSTELAREIRKEKYRA